MKNPAIFRMFIRRVAGFFEGIMQFPQSLMFEFGLPTKNPLSVGIDR